MDYEEFYQGIQVLEKQAADKLQGAQKSFKSLSRNADKGDLRGLAKDIASLKDALDGFREAADALGEAADGFDGEAYIASGDFASQMTGYCAQYAVDIKGEFPSYEIFPYRVRIDAVIENL